MKKKSKTNPLMFCPPDVRDRLDQQAKRLKMKRAAMLRAISLQPIEKIKPLVI